MDHDEANREPNSTPGLKIRLFGGLAIQDRQGVSFVPRSRKTRAIVAILTLNAPRPMQRSQLTALLWSQRGTEQGRASLRQAVHELQGKLGPVWNRILVAERHSLALNLEGVAVDVLNATATDASRTTLLTLLQDGFLDELGGLDPAFDQWLTRQRRHLVGLARIAAEAWLEEAPPRDGVVLTARALLRLEPASDVAWRALIEAHIQAGDRSAARFACEQWGEAMGLGAGDIPPPEMAAFLARIRFGAGSGVAVMDDLQLPEAPGATHGVPDRTNVRPADRRGPLRPGAPGAASAEGGSAGQTIPDGVGEDVTLPERPNKDRAMPFRLMPGGATRSVTSDATLRNRLAETVILPEHTASQSGANVIAPAWGAPRRILPDGGPETGDGVMEERIVPDRPPHSVKWAIDPQSVPVTWERDVAAEPGSGIAPRRSRSSLRLGIQEMRVIGPDVDAALSVGLAEEVTMALARFRWISCVSGGSLAATGGESGEPGLRWADLDLDLVLDGTIQRGGNRVRVTVRLLDVRAGEAVIWANRFDHDASDTLTVQDRVASAIVAQVDPLLLVREGERAASRNPRGVSPREFVLQAIPAIYRMDRLSFHGAGELLETALRADPGNTDALAWYAYWHLFLVGQGWTEEPEAATRRAGELADAAVAMDPNDARALTLAGHVRAFLLRQPAEAAVLHDRALALNPNLAIAWCFSGFASSYLGDHANALARMARAIELSPSDPHLFFFQGAIIMPHLLLGQYKEAAAAGRKAIELNPWFSSAFKGHLAALGYQAQTKETANVLARLLKLEPNFTVQDAVRRSPMTVAADRERYADGLRRAGLPEG